MSTETKSADIQLIQRILPHRYPFLLVDRIINVDGDRSATGVKNVTINEPFFVGHFPENPVMPGVLIVEAMAQTGGAICMNASATPTDLVYFMTIENAKFRRPVVPGDQLLIHPGAGRLAAEQALAVQQLVETALRIE